MKITPELLRSADLADSTGVPALTSFGRELRKSDSSKLLAMGQEVLTMKRRLEAIINEFVREAKIEKELA